MAIGSDRDKEIDNGFRVPLPLSSLLAFTLHVQKNIQSKMKELGISRNYQKMFNTELFGDECLRLKGLIDADSEQEFDDKLSKLVQVWDIREKAITKLKDTNFVPYFLKTVAEDMKTKMIRCVHKHGS